MGGPKKKSKAGNIALLFFLYMALNATGGAGIGQILFDDAAGYFQRVVLYLHFLVATDTQTMIGRFEIPGSKIFINSAGFGFLRCLGHIMTIACLAANNRLIIFPFMMACLALETKVDGMIKINGSPFCLNALQGFQQDRSHRDTHFVCITRSGYNHRISKNYRQNQTKNAKAYLIHPHLPGTDFVKWLNS